MIEICVRGTDTFCQFIKMQHTLCIMKRADTDWERQGETTSSTFCGATSKVCMWWRSKIIFALCVLVQMMLFSETYEMIYKFAFTGWGCKAYGQIARVVLTITVTLMHRACSKFCRGFVCDVCDAADARLFSVDNDGLLLLRFGSRGLDDSLNYGQGVRWLFMMLRMFGYD